MNPNSIVFLRQQPLIENYHVNTNDAWITDVAIVEGKNLDDPLHTTVSMNDELKTPFNMGMHRAVGGYHDLPNPGDMLCASLAACYENTMRMIADRLGIKLLSTKVKVSANVDVRGTLCVDHDVPVGFQKMQVDAEISLESPSEELTKILFKYTEKCCIIFQTVNKGIPVKMNTKILKTT